MDGTTKVSMEFFQDFRGSIDEFRALLAQLEIGRADREKYGVTYDEYPELDASEVDAMNVRKQRELYDALCSGIIAIHPTNTEHSVLNSDLGEWLFINSRYYRMARNNDAKPTYWEEWEVQDE